MDKLMLVDGHSILNRAFYGLPDLTNSKGEHTNAVLGFINIVFKIMEEEKPTHLAVAFDVHEKTFRHNMFEAYKGTRSGMPEELREQVPVMKELLHLMNVTVIEAPGFEADDIIGTMSRKGEEAGMEVSVLSGDRDLLQLATEKVLIKIPKTKGGKTTVENYHASQVFETYGVTPHEFIDMKGLMGDTSDNIPGVPGIGEKTAAKIISTYHSIENAYQHIAEIKPKKAMENLTTYYDQALMSRVLAEIKLDVPISQTVDEMKLTSLFTKEAYDYVKKLELKSLLKYFEVPDDVATIEFKIGIINDLGEMENFFTSINGSKRIGLFPLLEKEEFLGLGITVEDARADFIVCSMFITKELIVSRMMDIIEKNTDIVIVTHDLKKLLKILPVSADVKVCDVSVGAYLLNPNKDSYEYDDIARDYMNLTVPSQKELLEKMQLNVFVLQEEKVSMYLAYETCIPFMAWKNIEESLSSMDMLMLYEEIELPTVYVLDHMEREGIRVDGEALKEYGQKLGQRVDELEKIIYEEAGCEFNINSPKQLGEVLFDKLQLPGAKKTKTGYSTNVDVLNKLKNDYPIVANVLDYRQVAKLKSTYADGLSAFISEDGRIHGTFNQTITATGRISSTEPNLQNIPMRTELGRSIRKVFIPKEDYVFVDADYSQIELRVLAHFSGDEKLITAYKKEQDIHATTASQVFGVPMEEVDDLMRRNAKAVNFGIVYGISAFGLSEDLNISRKEATEYIENYFATYPGVKDFLDKTVEDAKKTGMSKTLYGRIRQIPELTSSNFMQKNFGERVAMNAPIQGTAADIIKIAMIRVHERLLKENCKSSLILQIHDELLIETHKSEVELVKNILVEEMTHAAKLSVPLSVGVSVGNTWYEAK
ncbi:MAG: DNA polymerase I [Lachnospiraceae bacterium]|nr:DNA polymerase I [Lachnospiraceae bacterium]